MPVHPTVVALLVAEGIHRDLLGKPYLLGVFHVFRAYKFPAALPQSAVYVALTDGRGDVPLTVRLVDAADEDAAPLFTFDLTVPFRSPLDVREVAVAPPALTFAEPGVYRWQVVCGGEVIHETRLVVESVGG